MDYRSLSKSKWCLRTVWKMFYTHIYVLSNIQAGRLTEHVQIQWLMSALGSYSRASNRLVASMENSDLYDLEQCRILNDQIIGVNQNPSSSYHRINTEYLKKNNPITVCLCVCR